MKKTANPTEKIEPIGRNSSQSSVLDSLVSLARWRQAGPKDIEPSKNIAVRAKAHFIRESRKHGSRWQWVHFPPPKSGESAGIAEILAVRKRYEVLSNHQGAVLKRLDALDILLINLRDHGAEMPSPEDIARMERVADLYRIGKVLLYQWNEREKTETGYRILNRETHRFGLVVRDSKELFFK